MSARTSPPAVSVIIPTRNRAQYLLRTLEAVARQEGAPPFEIIVVDNSSTDDTGGQVLSFAQAHPEVRLHCVSEPSLGVSHARNRGLAEAAGEIVAYLDDDSPPEPGWLAALTRVFSDQSVGLAGGPSYPDYQGLEPPLFFQGDLQSLLGVFTLPYARPTPVTTVPEFPFGCNLAIRRSVFDKLKPFRVDLGRSGGRALAGGETELVDRIRRAGWRVMYVPGAAVRHTQPASRLTKAHVYRIAGGLAASHVILTADPRPQIIVRWFLSDGWYATRMLGRLVAALARRNRLWFDDYIRFWIIWQRLVIRVRAVASRRYNAKGIAELTPGQTAAH